MEMMKAKELIVLKIKAVSNKCMIYLYQLFNHEFKFQGFVCNGCHDSIILCLNIRDINILTAKNVDYPCIILDLNKSQAINSLKKFVLEDRGYIQKMHIQEINIKNHVYNYHFENLSKANKLETKSILIEEKNCKDLMIYFI